ncbi:hypothetical protein L6452_20402 [Arctium lappa]|uniref:Uncharacterized protein n=1 Tax=Arctium lappa TaxID=4217 RepID=A0ACB9BBT4_ARCLA|nr:hypothetical protein L6452_20402 [Arctium lappa]
MQSSLPPSRRHAVQSPLSISPKTASPRLPLGISGDNDSHSVSPASPLSATRSPASFLESRSSTLYKDLRLVRFAIIMFWRNLGWQVLALNIVIIADPRLTDYDTLLKNIYDLKEGKSVEVPIYDLKSSSRTGLHLFFSQEQIFALRSKTKELEREIENQFFWFIELKDQEHALIEVQNNLLMEKERTEFLETEVSSMEIENKKFDEMVTEYLKALEELESLRFENGFLRRKVKKTRGSMRKRNYKIEAQEVELKGKENVIGEFEREVEEMRVMIDLLQDEKNEVL